MCVCSPHSPRYQYVLPRVEPSFLCPFKFVTQPTRRQPMSGRAFKSMEEEADDMAGVPRLDEDWQAYRGRPGSSLESIGGSVGWAEVNHNSFMRDAKFCRKCMVGQD